MVERPRKLRLGIFGVGMHFQETYAMAFRRSEISEIAEIVWVTDLKNKQELVLERCRHANQTPVFVGVDKFSGQQLPTKLQTLLDNTLQQHPVDAIIVSTTPEQHRAYSEWALTNRVPVIIDKPITARQSAAWDSRAAAGILEDWEALNALAKKHDTLAVVNSHRRFHPAYKKVCELLAEVAEETGVGVTALSSFNSDGQWRLPQELLDIHYHGYENGNGVISHFGYHYLDLATLWYKKGTPKARLADTMRVSSSFSSAQNYGKQMSTADASRALEKVGEPRPDDNDSSVLKDIATFGEVDAFCNVEMLKDDVLTAHMSIQLLHSGFSQRAWTKPATNLYKENGRVRWENHLIQQGPFQSIEVRSFQAAQPNWKKPNQGIPRWEQGGSDHLEINVYRNSILGKPVLETINCRDLLEEIPAHDVIHEDTKANVLLLFIHVVGEKLGLTLPTSLKARKQLQKILNADDAYDLSLLSTHQATAALMSACYESFANRQTEQNNQWVSKEILWG